MSEGSLSRLDHVVVAVRDLDRAGDRYQQLLGRRPSWRGEHGKLGTANMLFKLENTYLELLSPAGEGSLAPLLRQHLEEEGEGLFALAFGTADAEACAAALRRRGIEVAGPLDGEGKEVVTGAVRRWRNVYLPAEATRAVRLFTIEHLASGDALPDAVLLADEEASVTALDHVVVTSGDAGAAIRLYGEVLGLRLALDRTFEHRSLRLLFFRVGGVTVEISTALGVPPDASGADRLWGLAYRVCDVAAACMRLAAGGFDVSEVRQGHKSGTRVCTVRTETHGVATLLIQPAPPSRKKAGRSGAPSPSGRGSG